MNIKSFIVIIYILAGLLISASSAFLTYIIIGKPIKMPMIIQIVSTVLFMLPIIGLISYVFGSYLSKKFNFIKYRLNDIKEENFRKDETKNSIKELHDINQSMNFLSTQIDELIKDLKQKNHNLSNLLVSMAHDIKTPITILNGYLDEIEDDMIDEIQIPIAIRHMKEEVKYLDELTIDMLEFITSMQNHKKRDIINLYDFIEKEIFNILPKKSNIEYINDFERNSTIEFNKMDLKKIFFNILSNALKYTKNGCIKVYFKNNIIFFENSGEQIAKEYETKIFEPFFTIDESKNRRGSGFGLGLSIVKNLSKNNGYDCYLKLSEKEKTIFCLKNKISTSD